MRQIFPVASRSVVLLALISAPTLAQWEVAPPPPLEQAGGAAPAQGVTVRLLEPGAAPHQPLRLRLRPGQAQVMTLNIKMGMQMSANGQAMPTVDIPPMIMAAKMNVTGVDPAGNITAAFEYTKSEVVPGPNDNPQVVAAMQPALQSMIGLQGTVVVTPRGITKQVEIHMPENMAPEAVQQVEQMRQSMSQMSCPFPAEPVGVGGRWQVQMPIESGQMQLNQVATYTLREVLGDTIVCDVIMQQDAPQQIMEENGQRIVMQSLSTQGQGQMKMNLTKIVPDSQVAIQTRMNMHPEDQPQQQMQMNMTMNLTISGQDGPAGGGPAGPSGPGDAGGDGFF